jgi:hypothetical protein
LLCSSAVLHRPLYRAYQQNPEAVRQWKAEVAICEQAAKVSTTNHFTDEAYPRNERRPHSS